MQRHLLLLHKTLDGVDKYLTVRYLSDIIRRCSDAESTMIRRDVIYLAQAFSWLI